MKSPLFRQPLFYLSVLLAGALVFQVYGIVSAQSYVGPSGAPPAGNPAQPLDTSGVAQSKTGALTLRGNPSLVLNAGSGIPALRIEGDSSICLKDSLNGSVSCKPAYWDQIGGGANLWQQEAGTENIFYEGGDVRVVNNRVTETVRYYQATGAVVPGHPTPRLPCDISGSESTLDCGSREAASAGDPSIAYDWYSYDDVNPEEALPVFLSIPKVYAAPQDIAKEYELITETRIVESGGGNVLANDLDLVSPKWSKPIGVYQYNAGDARRLQYLANLRGILLDRSSRCPDGQFVVGLIVRDVSDWLVFQVECSSL